MFQRTERESWVSILPSISGKEAVEVTRVKLKAEPTFLFKGLRRQAHTAERVKTQYPRVKSLLFSLKILDTLKQKSACGSSISWVWQLFIVQLHYKILLDRHQNSSDLWDSSHPKAIRLSGIMGLQGLLTFFGGCGLLYAVGTILLYTALWHFGLCVGVWERHEMPRGREPCVVIPGIVEKLNQKKWGKKALCWWIRKAAVIARYPADCHVKQWLSLRGHTQL